MNRNNKDIIYLILIIILCLGTMSYLVYTVEPYDLYKLRELDLNYALSHPLPFLIAILFVFIITVLAFLLIKKEAVFRILLGWLIIIAITSSFQVESIVIEIANDPEYKYSAIFLENLFKAISITLAMIGVLNYSKIMEMYDNFHKNNATDCKD